MKKKKWITIVATSSRGLFPVTEAPKLNLNELDEKTRREIHQQKMENEKAAKLQRREQHHVRKHWRSTPPICLV